MSVRGRGAPVTYHNTLSSVASQLARASRSCPLIRVLHRISVEQEAATILIQPAEVQTDAALPCFEEPIVPEPDAR